MNKYLTPNKKGDHFTANKHYKIMHNYGNGRYLVQNDKGHAVIVRADGQKSSRLEYGGEFRLCSDLLNKALDVSKVVDALAVREMVRDSVSEAVKDGSLWGVKTGSRFIGDAFICSGATTSAKVENTIAERLAKAEKERDQYKKDCIKAEAVVDRLYDMFPHVKNPDQLISAVKSAKIFSDAFLELQKIK